MSDFNVPGLPSDLTWQVQPVSWEIDAAGVLHITAGRETDMFHDPAGGPRRANAPRALFAPDPLFTLSAHVEVDFVSTYDAGALLIWADDDHWGKLCFEYSPQKQPMVVSVVTNTHSDDCNSVTLARNEVFLRITRLGQAFAFHYSEDGRAWNLVRHFTLHQMANVHIGFVAQAPTGASCAARFSEIAYAPEPVRNIRSGE